MRFLNWLLVFGYVLLSVSSACAEPLKVSTSIKSPISTEDQSGFIDLLLRELFARVGVEFELVRLPAERALQLADEGYIDADLPRISGLEKKYPNLIEVPESLIDANLVAFMKAPAWDDLSWKKMAGEQVGLIIGWKIYEKNVPKEAKVLRVNSPQQLFQLLSLNRVKVALYEHYLGQHLLKEKGYSGIVEVSPPLAVRPLYLYLNKKHSALVETIAVELRKMKQDGSWQRIADETLDF